MSARGITGKRRRPKIHPRSAGPRFLSFRFLANNSPPSSFQQHGLPPSFGELSRGTLYPGLLPRPANQRDAPTRRLGRSSGQFHYVHPADDRTPMYEKNGWIRRVLERPKNARVIQRVSTDNCELPRFVVMIIYLFYTSSRFRMTDYRDCSKYQSVGLLSTTGSINFINFFSFDIK